MNPKEKNLEILRFLSLTNDFRENEKTNCIYGIRSNGPLKVSVHQIAEF